MGDSLGCIVREADEKCKPLPHSGNGVTTSSMPQSPLAELPLLLGTNANMKLSPLDDSAAALAIETKLDQKSGGLSGWRALDSASTETQTDGNLRVLPSPDGHVLTAKKARVERHRRNGVGSRQKGPKRTLHRYHGVVP